MKSCRQVLHRMRVIKSVHSTRTDYVSPCSLCARHGAISNLNNFLVDCQYRFETSFCIVGVYRSYWVYSWCTTSLFAYYRDLWAVFLLTPNSFSTQSSSLGERKWWWPSTWKMAFLLFKTGFSDQSAAPTAPPYLNSFELLWSTKKPLKKYKNKNFICVDGNGTTSGKFPSFNCLQHTCVAQAKACRTMTFEIRLALVCTGTNFIFVLLLKLRRQNSLCLSSHQFASTSKIIVFRFVFTLNLLLLAQYWAILHFCTTSALLVPYKHPQIIMKMSCARAYVV